MSMQSRIEERLSNSIAFSRLDVVNESHMHNVPPGSESHFKVLLISDDFVGLRLLARHRKINEALKKELKGGIHALSIEAFTRQEWEQREHQAKDSPPCHGGN